MRLPRNGFDRPTSGLALTAHLESLDRRSRLSTFLAIPRGVGGMGRRWRPLWDVGGRVDNLPTFSHTALPVDLEESLVHFVTR